MARPKTWLVAQLVEEDTPPVFKRMTADELRQLKQSGNWPEGIAIIDGELLKGFDKEFDVNRLKG